VDKSLSLKGLNSEFVLMAAVLLIDPDVHLNYIRSGESRKLLSNLLG
jgi:hypothetical protein